MRASVKEELEQQLAVKEALAIIREEEREEPLVEPALVKDIPLSERDNGRESLICDRCGRSFASQNALNAHRQWCKQRASEMSG